MTETSETVDTLRDAFRKSQRGLDKTLKEIAGWNDEIDKSASDRHAIYRRCRLEEIDLPLVRGNLEKVPIEENLGVAPEDMEVEDDGTQRPKEVKNWGVEPDFDMLEDDDKEVSRRLFLINAMSATGLTRGRIDLRRSTEISRAKSPSSKQIWRSSYRT